MTSVKLPETMKALRYEKAKKFSVQEIPLPEMRDTDIMVKIKASGVCGTDLHIHEGEFVARFPLVPGHEASGVVVAIGSNAQDKGFEIGDPVVAEPSELCDHCFHCRRGQNILCENFESHGCTINGGMAEYCCYPFEKLYKLKNISFLEATLVEPASCAVWGVKKIAPTIGSELLIFGAGATGLCLSQLLKQNGCSRVVMAAPEGLKMDLAKKLNAADEYIELSRENSEPQMKKLMAKNPHGFNIVVEATGSAKMLERAMDYVRRGGKLVVYGVYNNSDTVQFKPNRIFSDEITILGSFSEASQFPATLEYLESGRVNVKGIVNKTYHIDQWEECLEDIRTKKAIKAAVVFD